MLEKSVQPHQKSEIIEQFWICQLISKANSAQFQSWLDCRCWSAGRSLKQPTRFESNFNGTCSQNHWPLHWLLAFLTSVSKNRFCPSLFWNRCYMHNNLYTTAVTLACLINKAQVTFYTPLWKLILISVHAGALLQLKTSPITFHMSNRWIGFISWILS